MASLTNSGKQATFEPANCILDRTQLSALHADKEAEPNSEARRDCRI